MKMTKDEDRAITVLTADSMESILARGGSGDWVLNPDKANDCKFLVCCRNETWRTRKEGIKDKAAFLVGVVAGLREQPDTTNSRGQSRYLIEISQYAVVNIPEAWEKGVRNPLTYRTLKDLGIDVQRLKLKPLAAVAAEKSGGRSGKLMSIAEAKQALAESFGVSPEDVEITIRG
jgi:hypothetical protein